MKDKKYNCCIFKLYGWQLDQMLSEYIQDKLGKDIDTMYAEFTLDKKQNKHILNAEDNEFTLFVEYKK